MAASQLDDHQSASSQLPSTLPTCTVPPQQMAQHYGLQQTAPRLALLPAWLLEVQQLMQHYTQDINLHRTGGPLSSNSRHNLAKFLDLYAGYQVRWLGANQPALSSCLQPVTLAHFLSFMVARGNKQSTVQTYGQSLQLVQDYLISTAPIPAQNAHALQVCLLW